MHEPRLAPSDEILSAYKADGDWMRYERDFLTLLARRRVGEVIDKGLFAVPTVLLCSEPTSERCHRRLVVEYLHSQWGDIEQRDL